MGEGLVQIGSVGAVGCVVVEADANMIQQRTVSYNVFAEDRWGEENESEEEEESG